MLFFTSLIHAQSVGSYTSSSFNKEFDIDLTLIKKNRFAVDIHIASDRVDGVTFIRIEDKNIKEFVTKLEETKKIYSEWRAIAEDNEVEELSKAMDIKFPKTDIFWLGTKWFYAEGQRLRPYFLISKEKYSVFFCEKIAAKTNEFIKETIYWVFNDVDEIDEIINYLDYDKLQVMANEKREKGNLFN